MFQLVSYMHMLLPHDPYLSWKIVHDLSCLPQKLCLHLHIVSMAVLDLEETTFQVLGEGGEE